MIKLASKRPECNQFPSPTRLSGREGADSVSQPRLETPRKHSLKAREGLLQLKGTSERSGRPHSPEKASAASMSCCLQLAAAEMLPPQLPWASGGATSSPSPSKIAWKKVCAPRRPLKKTLSFSSCPNCSTARCSVAVLTNHLRKHATVHQSDLQVRESGTLKGGVHTPRFCGAEKSFNRLACLLAPRRVSLLSEDFDR